MSDANAEPVASPPAAPPAPAPAAGVRILDKMLDRLFASLVNGPSLNCRPHSSRQRVDVASLARLKDVSPEETLRRLLGEDRKGRLTARVPMPRRATNKRWRDRADSLEGEKTDEGDGNGKPEAVTDPEELARRQAEREWDEQQALLNKLRIIVEDAKTYEQDTGVHALNIGYPLLSIPPGTFGSQPGGAASRRVIAPVAFIPVTLKVNQGTTRTIELACKSDGVDLIVPNAALFAWLEQQSGAPREEIFADDTGARPWREIVELVRRACKLTGIPTPAAFIPAPLDIDAAGDKEKKSADVLPKDLVLKPAPRADTTEEAPAILESAVLGLFPTAKQGLLRDLQAMTEGEAVTGPVESFLRVDVSADRAPRREEDEPDPQSPTSNLKSSPPRSFPDERLIAPSDPFQARAVKLARESRTLVIHGPPGTGKSQTITNIIGDHLSRGQRVLLVCEKRTALDVVYNRLEHMGLARLCAVVHDPQRDQRELYRNLRQQLDELAEAKSNERAEARLEKIDAELARLHWELTAYHNAVMSRDPKTGHSFHDLVGQWFQTVVNTAVELDDKLLAGATLDQLDEHSQSIGELFTRADDIEYTTNPWRQAAGANLAEFLKRPMAALRASAGTCVREARTLDSRFDPSVPPFAPKIDLGEQSRLRLELADETQRLLDTSDPAVLSRWATQPPDAIERERQRVQAMQPLIDTFRSTPLEGDLLAIVRHGLPSIPALTDAHATLKKYAEAYHKWAALFAHVKQRVSTAPTPAIVQWLGKDRAVLEPVLAKLEELQPLVEQIKAGPLERPMFSQYQRQPIPVGQILTWITLLSEYLDKASKWYGFLFPGPKAKAAPIAAYFGLTLNKFTAQQIKAFLTGIRLRLDLLDELRRTVPGLHLPDRPDDNQLLGAATEHTGILRALLESPAQPAAETAATTKTDVAAAATGVDDADLAPPEVIHPLIPGELAAITPIVNTYRLRPLPRDVKRLRSFFKGLHARLLLIDLHHALSQTPPAGLMDDPLLERSITSHTRLFDLLTRVRSNPSLSNLTDALSRALADRQQAVTFLQGLRNSPARAQALERFFESVRSAGLFAEDWTARTDDQLRAHTPASPLFNELHDRMDSLEHVLRIRDTLAQLPDTLRPAVQDLLDRAVPMEDALAAIRRDVAADEIGRRIDADPQLHAIDAQRLKGSFDRYGKLQDEKRDVARDAIIARWQGRQKERLLSGTGTRLNNLGADLKRRLTIRGERATRLRQVIAAGLSKGEARVAPASEAQDAPAGESEIANLKSEIENPLDPLFDLSPVWMASPETVAQLFPRLPLFDIVIFDEASQCRLEEALPVLTRATRVVIAGDPRQLPPTRFFETALVINDDEADVNTEQALFEQHQGEIEDLLEAALGLQIDEAYLDVHYRSRHADLIEFSNEHFYNSRLQPIPGHPSKRPKLPPVRLYLANGTYQKRGNEAEASKVVEIVRELLARKNPPSIGIACFNLPQHDLIVEALDDAAAEDSDFAERLEAAYERTGEGSFEGLFVKNLENVQGDERDHIIISTTYGPDAKGRFYRRFGPLGRQGGGRRLNVLVTRSREQVHLITSIPADAYRSLPDVPDGQSPGGAYLLFAYLNYAHRLAREYEAPDGEGEAPAEPKPGEPRILPTRHPSPFAEALAHHLARKHAIGSEVHWGNEGFAIDLALRNPDREQVTLGLLCDGTRFAAAEDPIEWDLFRTTIHENQGWKLHRLWTPHFFRDPAGATHGILRATGIKTVPQPEPAPEVTEEPAQPAEPMALTDEPPPAPDQATSPAPSTSDISSDV